MGLSLGMVWEVRATGSDNNGGGFRGGANLATPSAPGVSTSTSGGLIGANTYYVVITLRDGNGETPKSAETPVTTTGSSSTITVTTPTNPNSPGATWNIYVATASGGPYFADFMQLTFGSSKVLTNTPDTFGTQAPGADRSQQNSAQLVIDNGTITATTPSASSNTLTFTSGYTPTSADVGNVVKITGGSNVNTDRYEITGWSATTWTLTSYSGGNLTTGGGAGSAITGNMGGALGTLGTLASAALLSNNSFHLSSGTYTLTSTVNFTNIGAVSGFGYGTNRFDGGTRPLVTSATNGVSLLTFNAGIGSSLWLLSHIAFSHTASTRGNGLDTPSSGGGIVYDMRVVDCTFDGCKYAVYGDFVVNYCFGNLYMENCEVKNCTSGGIINSAGIILVGCSLHNNTGRAVETGTNTQLPHSPYVFNDTVLANNGYGVYINNGDSHTILANNCTFYGQSNDGIFRNDNLSSGVCRIDNCLFYSQAGKDINANASGTLSGNNNAFSAPSQIATGVWMRIQLSRTILLTANPFTNAGSNDFSLNNTAGGGAALRAAGFPSSFAGLSTNNYMDIGAAQHQDLPSSSNTIILC